MTQQLFEWESSRFCSIDVIRLTFPIEPKQQARGVSARFYRLYARGANPTKATCFRQALHGTCRWYGERPTTSLAIERKEIMIKAIYPAYKPKVVLTLLLALVTTFAAACAATPTQESTGGYIDDATITTKVKANLAQDPKVSATDVHVKTYKGVVDLSGFVNSNSEIAQAGLVANQVSGVKSVHNNLIVKGVVAPPTAAEKRAD
jgi:BON domain